MACKKKYELFMLKSINLGIKVQKTYHEKQVKCDILLFMHFLSFMIIFIKFKLKYLLNQVF